MLQLLLSAHAETNWTAIGAIAGLLGFVAILAGYAAKRFNTWRNRHIVADSLDERIVTALFGKDAELPFPKIEGLIEGHGKLVEQVTEIHHRTTAMEIAMLSMQEQLGELIARTEENGGGSIKDQLNMIEEYVTGRNKTDGQTASQLDKIGKDIKHLQDEQDRQHPGGPDEVSI